ncbi:DUF2142 domain-containing protein [Streptococcus equinus]|uniref:DUF2142 domain-containing protein n=1 Tax=Streptococcus equinus TaxID=1335 RepID=UPI003BF83C42
MISKGYFIKQKFERIAQSTADIITSNWKSYSLLLLVFLIMYVVYGDNNDIPVKLTLVLFIIGIFLISIPIMKIEYRTAIFILIMGITSACLSPINDIPDEPVHYQRSLFLSEGDLNLSNNFKNLLESEDYAQIDTETGETISNSHLKSVLPSNKEIVNERLTVTNAYYIFGYLPQAIGLKIGNILDISIIFSYLLGRIFNVIAYAILIFIAINISGKLAQIISVASLLPMNIYLAGSYNQDTIGLGIILLILSLLAHFYQESSKIKTWKIFIYVFLCSILATIKLPFILFIFLLLFIPNNSFNLNKKKVYLIKFLGVFLVILVTIFWMKTYSEIINVNYLNVDYLANVDAKKQILSIISQPFVYFKVLLGEFFMRLLNPANINLFGWLSYGPTFLISYLILFLVIVVFNNSNKVEIGFLERSSLFVVIIGLYAGIILAMYLTWTPVGAFKVEGVQDRYVLGIIPALLIFMSVNNKNLEKFRDFISEKIILDISLCFIYTMLLSTVFNYYNF